MLRPSPRPVRLLLIALAVAFVGVAPAIAQPRSLGAPYLVKVIGTAQYLALSRHSCHQPH